jgi:hypothetical protein
MTDRDQAGPDDESSAESGAPEDGNGEQLLPAADPGTTDAEKYSTKEGRTEEDLEP